jgi:hypothetical protein
VTHHRRLDPGPSRLVSGQQDHGLRRTATRPGATATRNTPVAQSEEVATRRQRPNPGSPHARTHRPATQRHGDSDPITTTDRSCRATELRGPLSDRCRPRDVRQGHVHGLLTVGTAAHQGGERSQDHRRLHGTATGRAGTRFAFGLRPLHRLLMFFPFCLTFQFFLRRSIVIVAALWQIFSAHIHMRDSGPPHLNQDLLCEYFSRKYLRRPMNSCKRTWSSFWEM